MHMVPAIRNILGGFLFSGDDVYKQVRVLSGGERTRLAVARMLLRPSNTLLLDEPTNHLDLDSKEVLLDALVDYGGTLIFVSHDRYFVERLATKIIEVGSGTAIVYPGTYKEFLWHKEHPRGAGAGRSAGSAGRQDSARSSRKRGSGRERTTEQRAGAAVRSRHATAADSGRITRREETRRRRSAQAAARRRRRGRRASTTLEARIAECEAAIREIEQTMAAPGFYDDRAAAQPVIDRIRR